MNVRWWSALQPVWNVGWCALVVQQQNTSTRRLTEPMLDGIFLRVRELI